jgi:uncharacterized protein DUF2845
LVHYQLFLSQNGRRPPEPNTPTTALCGVSPSHVESTAGVLPELVYDALRGTYLYIPTHVDKSVWVYNFGPTQLIYRLTFRENTLVKIETGGYGGF